MGRTLVMDLDGTICATTRGGDAYFSADPIQTVIYRVNELKSKGWTVIIHTARGMNLYNGNLARIELEFRSRTEKWLRDNLVEYDQLIFGKPAGDVYVDDKGVSPLEFTSKDF